MDALLLNPIVLFFAIPAVVLVATAVVIAAIEAATNTIIADWLDQLGALYSRSRRKIQGKGPEKWGEW